MSTMQLQMELRDIYVDRKINMYIIPILMASDVVDLPSWDLILWLKLYDVIRR